MSDIFLAFSSVADPNQTFLQFDADPNQTFLQFDADPDPTTNFFPYLDNPMLQNGPLRLHLLFTSMRSGSCFSL